MEGTLHGFKAQSRNFPWGGKKSRRSWGRLVYLLKEYRTKHLPSTKQVPWSLNLPTLLGRGLNTLLQLSPKPRVRNSLAACPLCAQATEKFSFELPHHVSDTKYIYFSGWIIQSHSCKVGIKNESHRCQAWHELKIPQAELVTSFVCWYQELLVNSLDHQTVIFVSLHFLLSA